MVLNKCSALLVFYSVAYHVQIQCKYKDDDKQMMFGYRCQCRFVPNSHFFIVIIL